VENKTTLIVAIAGFLHDIGKFAERGEMILPETYSDKDRVSGLYLPFDKKSNRYTHKHALYSAAFIEKYNEFIPKEIIGTGEDTLLNLVGCHHNPNTSLQWIATEADRIASGFERESNEADGQGISIKRFRETRLVSIFEEILLDQVDNIESLKWRYPLRTLSPSGIFPSEEAEPDDGKYDYNNLFATFESLIEDLPDKDNAELWFEHFESLFLRFTANIPSATVGRIIPDASLYDHSRATSAIAAAMYRYHKETNSLQINEVKDCGKEKFLLIAGDFFGIQDFISLSGGATNKNASKLLRGRSFAVSLISSLAADLLCRELGLPHISTVLNVAGKFMIIAQNTTSAIQSIAKVKDRINEWLFKHFFGETTFGLATISATANDFKMDKEKGFSTLQRCLAQALSECKFNKIDLNKYGGAVTDFLDHFNNNLGVCTYCGKRPATQILDEYSSCSICADHKLFGEKIIHLPQIVITDLSGSGSADKISEPIFDNYIVFLDENNGRNVTSKPLRRWQLTMPETGSGIAMRFIGGHLPRFDNGEPKTFEDIAKSSVAKDIEGNEIGTEAIGILKADLDNLGEFFFRAGKTGRMNMSRSATLSRQLEFFFSLWLPDFLSRNEMYHDIYTVFAGGDDLFLVGPWNVIITFVTELNDHFREFVAKNEKLTLSCGITLHKPSVPIPYLSSSTERALKLSKGKKEKKSITLFGQTVTWERFAELNDIYKKIEEYIDRKILNTAMLLRLIRLSAMASKEKSMTQGVKINELEALKWRSYLYYSFARNIKDNDAVEKLSASFVSWIEQYGEDMKIPLWRILYERRGGRKK